MIRVAPASGNRLSQHGDASPFRVVTLESPFATAWALERV